MILGLLTLAVLAVIIALVIREWHHILYVRDVRRMRIITEHQARQNAAPLSNAVTHRDDQ